MTSLGVGLWPGAPGTYGSALTAAAVGGLTWAGGQPLAGVWFWLALALVTGLALYSVAQALRRRVFGSSHDPGAIVIDEAAGQLVALYGVSGFGWELFLGFLFFRLFDIWKPFPVYQSQSLPGTWGVVTDDLLAGVYALGALRLAAWLGSWLLT
ncbi:MAG: phosphatidylglycerophosphatase A [Deltaproteobacteria bacterium]|nr:phosphatidylglycerophosphatase A [Deltaproteobacteria bacterium]